MKKLIFLLLSIFMFNCTNDSEQLIKDDFIEVSVPDSFQTKLGENTILGKTQS